MLNHTRKSRLFLLLCDQTLQTVHRSQCPTLEIPFKSVFFCFYNCLVIFNFDIFQKFYAGK